FAHAFTDQLIAHSFGIGNHFMRKIVSTPFYKPLYISAPTCSFAPRCYTRGHACEHRGRHSEYVCVEVVRMDNVDFALPQELSEPAKLLESIAIVKAPQRELRDFCKAGLHRLASQNAVRIQTSDMHTIAPIFFEQPRKLD